MTADIIEFEQAYQIESVIDNNFSLRLLEMGCSKGTEIIKVLEAPFGDPIAYVIGSSFVLALRRCEAQSIIVTKKFG